MHHTLAKLRADLDEDIASENRAIARIEQAIDERTFPSCSYCSANASLACMACDTDLCEDDGIVKGNDVFCPECLGLRP